MERHLHGRETDHQKPRHENVGGGHETQVTEPHHPDGTPIQNYLSELWNLFQFLNPSLLGTFNSFMQKYIVPIEQNGDKERQRQPKQMITSFLLRRTKAEVIEELSEKTDIKIHLILDNK